MTPEQALDVLTAECRTPGIVPTGTLLGAFIILRTLVARPPVAQALTEVTEHVVAMMDSLDDQVDHQQVHEQLRSLLVLLQALGR